MAAKLQKSVVSILPWLLIASLEALNDGGVSWGGNREESLW